MNKYLLIIIAYFIVAMFDSCKPIETIREVKGETVIEYRNKIIHDSLTTLKHDSIYINGDTLKVFSKIFVDKWHNRVDTIYKTRDVNHVKETVKIEHVSFFAWVKIAFYGFIFGLAIGLLAKYWVRIMTFF